MKRVRYGKDYVFPLWAELMGWCVAFLSIIAIPLGAVHAIYKADGNTIMQVTNFREKNLSLSYRKPLSDDTVRCRVTHMV